MMNILHKIKIDYTTYILIILALLAGYIKNVLIILIIILVHELGHVFFFIVFKIDIEKIIIYPFGGMSFVNKKIHERIYKDILISLGGIILQVLLSFVFYILYINNIIVLSTYELFILYNVNIIIFNIIPIIPLDGSKFILALLSKFFSYKISYILYIVIGIISLYLFILYNYIIKINDIILIMYLFLKLIDAIRNYRYIMNRFYLERILYDHYYNKIIYSNNINRMKLDKYYYFIYKGRYINEKKYIENIYYSK